MVQFYFNRPIHIVIEVWNKERRARTLEMAQSALFTVFDSLSVCVCERGRQEGTGIVRREDSGGRVREEELLLLNSPCWRCTTSGIFCHLIHFSSVANSQGIFSITEKWIVCVSTWVCRHWSVSVFVSTCIQNERQAQQDRGNQEEKSKKRAFHRWKMWGSEVVSQQVPVSFIVGLGLINRQETKSKMAKGRWNRENKNDGILPWKEKILHNPCL